MYKDFMMVMSHLSNKRVFFYHYLLIGAYLGTYMYSYFFVIFVIYFLRFFLDRVYFGIKLSTPCG